MKDRKTDKKEQYATAKILVTVVCKNEIRYRNEEMLLEEVRNYFPLDDVCPIELEKNILKYGEHRIGDYYDPQGPYWIRVV